MIIPIQINDTKRKWKNIAERYENIQKMRHYKPYLQGEGKVEEPVMKKNK